MAIKSDDMKISSWFNMVKNMFSYFFAAPKLSLQMHKHIGIKMNTE